MIFETLHESAQKGELILIDGGYLRYHLRRDKTITIHEILSLKPGAGRAMLAMLVQRGRCAGATMIRAKCPADLAANGWYSRMGFAVGGTEDTPSGRKLNLWHLSL